MNLSIADSGAFLHPEIEGARPKGKSNRHSHRLVQLDKSTGFERLFLAVLFADVANYCHMIEVDDLGTVFHLERLKAEVIEPIAEIHEAHFVRSFGGDGLIVSFVDPLLAIRCAIDLQARVQANTGCWPGDEQFRLRIGIAMGSVILVNGDLHGSALNVAARLQALAEPGDIWITEPVAREAFSQADITLQALGRLRLKNIEEDVEAYRVARENRASSKCTTFSSKVSLGDDR